MYDEDFEDDANYEVDSAFNIILLTSVFARLDRHFTTEEFMRSFRKTFINVNDYKTVRGALDEAVESELISSIDDDKFEFNGIFWWTEDLN